MAEQRTFVADAAERGDTRHERPVATLIHISDLHFSGNFTTDEEWLKRKLASLPFVAATFGHSFQAAQATAIRIHAIIEDRKKRRIPSCVIMSGDLTASGKEAEFACGTTYLRGEHFLGTVSVGLKLGPDRDPIVLGNAPGLFMIPGNHDIWHRRSPKVLGAYSRYFPKAYPVRCEIEAVHGKIILYGLNTSQGTISRHMLARGAVPSSDLEALCEQIRVDASDDTIQIVVMHHPLSDGSSPIDPRMRLDDREVIAARLESAGVALVLSGHVHSHYCVERVPSATPSHVVAASATQQFEERSFAVVDVFPESIRVFKYKQSRSTHQFKLDLTQVAFLPRTLPVSVGDIAI